MPLVPPYDAAVRMHNGRPMFFVNDEPVYPLIYALTDAPGGRWSWEEIPQHNIRQFAQMAGCKLFQLDLFFDFVWTSPEQFDLTPARRQIQGVLNICSDAAVMFRLHVRPPRWWTAKHPEEQTVFLDAETTPDYPDGIQRLLEEDLQPRPRTSLASTLWLEEMGTMVARFCCELAATPEGDNLIGIQVAGGVYGEWHYWGFNNHEVDSGAPMKQAFRAWLRARYSTDAALQAAWADPRVTLASATVPGPAARSTTQDGVFRDPQAERPIIDYFACQHECVAEAILDFCKIVKTHWPRPIITGAFYGYVYCVFGREAEGGHLAVQRVLASPHIDFLCGPGYGADKSLGSEYRSRGLPLSARLFGKIWLDEMDQMPVLPSILDVNYASDIRDGIALTLRNQLNAHTKGAGLWFYDFGVAGSYSLPKERRRTENVCAAGWWDDPRMMAAIGQAHTVMCRYAERPYVSGSDVLIVHDTESYLYTAINLEQDPVTNTLVTWAPLGVARAGYAYDGIYLDNLDAIDLTPYRVILFTNTYVMTRARREAVRRLVATDGRHCVWCYAAGYIDGTRGQAASISALTGITIRRRDFNDKPVITLSAALSPTSQYSCVFGGLAPAFVVEVAATALGWYQTGDVAVARKDRPDDGGADWYMALPSYDHAPLTGVLTHSPAHRYSDAGDIVGAGGGLLVVHSTGCGQHPIRLRDGRVVEVQVDDPFATFALDAETGDVVLPGFV